LFSALGKSTYQFIRAIPISVDRRHAPITESPGRWRLRDRFLSPFREGRTMFTVQQYRAKAAEYDGFLAAARSPAEVAEYRDLKHSYASHADNLDWLAENAGKTMSTGVREPPRRRRRDRDGAYADQENILRCLGAAVTLNWNTIPTKLQRALFETANNIQDTGRTAPPKDELAQFLHDHKDDAAKQKQRYRA
jgi:hypothetical protein